MRFHLNSHTLGFHPQSQKKKINKQPQQNVTRVPVELIILTETKVRLFEVIHQGILDQAVAHCYLIRLRKKRLIPLVGKLVKHDRSSYI